MAKSIEKTRKETPLLVTSRLMAGKGMRTQWLSVWVMVERRSETSMKKPRISTMPNESSRCLTMATKACLRGGTCQIWLSEACSSPNALEALKRRMTTLMAAPHEAVLGDAAWSRISWTAPTAWSPIVLRACAVMLATTCELLV